MLLFFLKTFHRLINYTFFFIHRQLFYHTFGSILGGNLIYDFRGPTKDYILSELERRKTELRTQLVWIGAQKEPGLTSRTWKWVNGEIFLF